MTFATELSFVVWTMPLPWAGEPLGRGRLVSTPSKIALGLARRCHGQLLTRGFTEFDPIQSLLSPVTAH